MLRQEMGTVVLHHQITLATRMKMALYLRLLLIKLRLVVLVLLFVDQTGVFRPMYPSDCA